MTAPDIAKLKKIIDDLNSPRPYFRGKAVEALMAIRDETVIPQLFKLVTADSDFVKIQFCRLLGNIKTGPAVPALAILLLDKSERVVREAADALDRIDIGKKTEAFISMLKRRVVHFPRMFSIRSLGLGKAYQAVPYLIDLLSGEDREVKGLAIEALRQIGDPVSVQALVKLLHDKNDDIVYATLLALGELDGHKTGDDVIACLGHANANIRRAAVWALAKLRYERAIPHFIRMLRTDESQVVRQEIAKRLGQMGGPLAVAPLVSAKAHDADHNVRIYAEWALADIPLNNKEATLLKLADGPDDAIRGEAMLEIGKSGDRRFCGLLANALAKDRSVYVRARAAEAFSFLRGCDIKPNLLEALKDSEDVRQKAADSLFQLAGPGDGTLGAAMVAGTVCDNSYVRHAGIKILEKIYFERGAPEAILKTLRSIVSGEDADLGKAAVRCLGLIGDQETASFLETLELGSAADLSGVIDEAIRHIEQRFSKRR